MESHQDTSLLSHSANSPYCTPGTVGHPPHRDSVSTRVIAPDGADAVSILLWPLLILEFIRQLGHQPGQAVPCHSPRGRDVNWFWGQISPAMRSPRKLQLCPSSFKFEFCSHGPPRPKGFCFFLEAAQMMEMGAALWQSALFAMKTQRAFDPSVPVA